MRLRKSKKIIKKEKNNIYTIKVIKIRQTLGFVCLILKKINYLFKKVYMTP